MRQIIVIFSILTFTSCDFKTSADYNAAAEELERVGKYSEAIPLLDKAIEKDPKNIYALINRAVDKVMLEDYQGAILDYTQVLAIDSHNTLAWFNRGKNKKRLEDHQGSLADFERAIKTKGTEGLYFNKVENSFIDTGSEFNVTMEEIRFERGIARYDIDSLHLAAADFDFCIQMNYHKSASLYWRGIIFLNYGLTDEGCEDLYKSHELGSSDAQRIIDTYCK